MNRKIKKMTYRWLINPAAMASRTGLLAMLCLAGAAIAAPTADHTQFEILNQPFKTGPEVTAACLSCHTEAAKQIMNTRHWTWLIEKPAEDAASGKFGKAQGIINNFCIAVESNEPRCTSCHVGYGWKDKSFDFSIETNVDCLICHDTTKSYRKFPVDAGHPNYVKKEWPKGSGKYWEPVDLNKVARNVGKPSRHTCGACHFFGGGGEGVKHGDMDESLGMPDRALDVHMNIVDKRPDGSAPADFNCIECHTVSDHVIAGRSYTIPAYESREYVMRGDDMGKNLLACESCHTPEPHANKRLNDHSNKVSCQACHIPTMARVRPTKMWWDWSKAGKKNDGKPIAKKVDVKGTKVLEYHTKKGEFIWAKDEAPEYAWFNGNVEHMFVGDKLDALPTEHIECKGSGQFDKLDHTKNTYHINRLIGDYSDPNSRIWPVKFHRGIQPYDVKNNTLVVPKLFPGKGPDAKEAYWKSYDWERAVVAGMNYIGQDYSGELGWVQTEMAWPLSHMVAPKEDAVSCNSCHAKNGRLAKLPGFYMPGRDSHAALDGFGIIVIAVSIVGAAVHGLLRVVIRPKA